jgi:hypothetical protein
VPSKGRSRKKVPEEEVVRRSASLSLPSCLNVGPGADIRPEFMMKRREKRTTRPPGPAVGEVLFACTEVMKMSHPVRYLELDGSHLS